MTIYGKILREVEWDKTYVVLEIKPIDSDAIFITSTPETYQEMIIREPQEDIKIECYIQGITMTDCNDNEYYENDIYVTRIFHLVTM